MQIQKQETKLFLQLLILKAVCNIRIAVDRKGREKETDFFSCTAFGQTGDALATYATKGRLVAIVGKIQLDNYTDKEGVKKQSIKIIVDQWTLLDSRKEQGKTGLFVGLALVVMLFL